VADPEPSVITKRVQKIQQPTFDEDPQATEVTKSEKVLSDHCQQKKKSVDLMYQTG